MDSPANAAIYYIPEGYSTDGDRLMGINAASEGFVRGLARHADIPAAYCVVDDGAAAEAFAGVVQAERPHLPVKALPSTTPALLAEPGCVYLPGPGLSAFAWRRRHLDPRQYSLCGITHTTASAGIMDALADFPIAPIQPWDALICTSRAVRQMVETLIEGQAAYLAERLGATMPPLPHLPVIPLGVDCDRFLDDQASRTAWRDRLGIAPDDVAILFVGRLSFHGKAHPLPLFISLEAAAVRTGRRLHLIMAGWFGSESVEAAFKDAARQLCPSVDVLFLDGREAEVRNSIWRAADIFASLADNIQESFGLTPLEAMAAGLPVVASDWDGYRDTVRHGTDGFLIQSLMAPAPLGGDLADRHASGLTNYDRYIGEVAQFTALDLNACTAAFTALIDDADLRRRMGPATLRLAGRDRSVSGAMGRTWTPSRRRGTRPAGARHSDHPAGQAGSVSCLCRLSVAASRRHVPDLARARRPRAIAVAAPLADDRFRRAGAAGGGRSGAYPDAAGEGTLDGGEPDGHIPAAAPGHCHARHRLAGKVRHRGDRLS
jgi:starch synthase